MAVLDLHDLVDWTRRVGGDMLQPQNQNVNTDGTAIVTFNASGNIVVTQVLEGTVTLDESEYTANSNVIVLQTDPTIGTSVTIFFSAATYLDSDILDFLVDSARGVSGDMKQGWIVDPNAYTITDASGLQQLNDDNGNIRPEIEQLIVMNAAFHVFASKANQAAQDAAKIRDSDTSIDTSPAAVATERSLTRILNLYTAALKTVRVEGFIGSMLDMENIPVRYPFLKFPYGYGVV